MSSVHESRDRRGLLFGFNSGSLEAGSLASRNPALKSCSQCRCLIFLLFLGWPLINQSASHAHQLLPLRDGDNDVLLCCHQRQTQQVASEQSWILSWEGEQGSGWCPAVVSICRDSPVRPYPPLWVSPVLFIPSSLYCWLWVWCWVFTCVPVPL
jgi:hypothetical protein